MPRYAQPTFFGPHMKYQDGFRSQCLWITGYTSKPLAITHLAELRPFSRLYYHYYFSLASNLTTGWRSYPRSPLTQTFIEQRFNANFVSENRNNLMHLGSLQSTEEASLVLSKLPKCIQIRYTHAKHEPLVKLSPNVL